MSDCENGKRQPQEMKTPRVPGERSLFSNAELEVLTDDTVETSPTPKTRDRLVAFREFGGWTLNKLEVLEKYLKMYRRVAGGGTFIDAFAGTGRGLVTQNNDERPCDGSSVIAARSGSFSALHLIEIDHRNIETLTSVVKSLPRNQSRKIRIHTADCNRLIPELLTSNTLDDSKPCFVLLDQDSTQLDWATIEALATWKTYKPPLT